MQISGSSGGTTPAHGLGQSSHGAQANDSRLSRKSGLQRPGDDSVGSRIAASLDSGSRALDNAAKGLSDGIQIMRSAGGKLQEVRELLVEMRELAIQSSHGAPTQRDREAIQAEFDGLRKRVDALSSKAESKAQGLFEGPDAALSIPLAKESGERLELRLEGFSANHMGIESDDLSSAAGASASLDKLDHALESVDDSEVALGATEHQLTSGLRSVAESKLDLTQTRGTISTADQAAETAAQTQQELLQGGTPTVLLQSNVANSRAQSLLGGYS